MWDFELRLLQDRRAKQDEIEIQRPCGAWKWPLASCGLLDILKRVEEFVNIERGVAHRGRIQEFWLNADHSNRFGFEECRQTEIFEKAPEVLFREVHVSLTVAEI